MASLEDTSIEELESALDEAETKQETERLMVAVLYKRGPSVPMIAEWYDMREATIYNWLARLEERPLEDALTDDHRSGRPPKLDDEAFGTFESAVNQPPTESGYEQPAWSTSLAQKFLREEFDVEYSQRHVQRLLKRAGLSHQTPRPQPPTADEDERQQFWESIKKKLTSSLPENYTTVAIDQTRKTVGCDLYRAWFPKGERIPLPYWSESSAIKLLGAVTEDGETVFSEVNGSFNSDVTVHYLRALQDELGEHLHVVLDNAS